MNTKVVLKTKVTKLYYFPELSDSDRIITKHFTNLIYTIPANKLALLGFIIHNSDTDKTKNISSY